MAGSKVSSDVKPAESGGVDYSADKAPQDTTPVDSQKRNQARASSDATPQAAVLAYWKDKIQQPARVFRKTAKMLARVALQDGEVSTMVDDEVEAVTKYKKGDFILVGSRGGQYPMSADVFKSRYQVEKPEPTSDTVRSSDGFQLFLSTGKVWALQLTEEDVTKHFCDGRFVGAWGGTVSERCPCTAFFAVHCRRRRMSSSSSYFSVAIAC